MEHLNFGLELKFASDAEPGTISGYGAVFNNEDRGGDVILKGAFKDTLKDARKSGIWPVMFLDHGPYYGGGDLPLGVWTSLEEDDYGLRVEGKVAVGTERGAEILGSHFREPRLSKHTASRPDMRTACSLFAAITPHIIDISRCPRTRSW